jgi:death-on-curing family protein
LDGNRLLEGVDLKGLLYPSDHEIIQINKEILESIRVKNADAHSVLKPVALKNSLLAMLYDPGDLFDKVASLLISLVRRHPFESRNQRTAYVISKAFLIANGANPKIVQDEDVFLGIRAGFYSKSEIKDWLKGNEIRKFSR